MLTVQWTVAQRGPERSGDLPLDGAKHRMLIHARASDKLLPAGRDSDSPSGVNIEVRYYLTVIDGLCPFADPAFSDQLIHIRLLLSYFRALSFDDTHFVLRAF